MSFEQALFALSLSAGLVASVGAAAQPMRHDGFREILAAAQLSASQKQQVHQLLQAAHARNGTQHAQMQALHRQIEQTLFSSGDVTAAQLTPLLQQEDSLRQQLEASRIQTILSIRALLTPAQIAQASHAQAQLATLHQQEHAITHPGAADGGD